MQGISHAETNSVSPCAASAPACSPPIGPMPGRMSLMQRDTVQVGEPFALLRILCYKYDFVNDLFKGADESFDECPALINEEVFLLPIGTTSFPPYEDHR